MADIREILAALSTEDRAMYTQHRNEMRKSYLLAHNQTIGMDKWDSFDDQFLDYVDITLALLYDRAGRLVATKNIVGDDKAKIEQDIDTIENNLKKINIATNLDGWSNGAAKS
jgi:hypothetical protein